MAKKTALELAAEALARRDHSTAELAASLERSGVDATEAAQAVERLAAAGYVDDERAAASRAEALAARGYGDAAIRCDLEGRGLAPPAVQAALATLEPEAERARRLLERSGASARTARRLAARGFDAESLEAAFAARAGGNA